MRQYFQFKSSILDQLPFFFNYVCPKAQPMAEDITYVTQTSPASGIDKKEVMTWLHLYSLSIIWRAVDKVFSEFLDNIVICKI